MPQALGSRGQFTHPLSNNLPLCSMLQARSYLGSWFFPRQYETSKHGWRTVYAWGEVTGKLSLALELINWSEDGRWTLHVHLPWPNLYVKLPLPCREPKEQILDKWGFSLVDDAVHLSWGHHTKIVELPWAYTWHRTSILLHNGGWDHDKVTDKYPSGYQRYERQRQVKASEGWSATYPYTYTLKSGEVQHRLATVHVEEREWRRHLLKYLPYWAKVVRSIDVMFDDEVGERTGSWKGGAIGCGYELLPNETPEQCLRRMERERKF